MTPAPIIFKALRWLWKQPAVQGLASVAVERVITWSLKKLKARRDKKKK